MKIAIENGMIVTMNKRREIIQDGTIIIENDRIVEVGKTEELKKYLGIEKKLDAKGKVIIPGLVNCHTHLFQTLMRGLGDGLNLIPWLNEMMYPLGRAMTPEDASIGNLLGCIENIKSGVTCVVDNHHVPVSKNILEKLVENYKKTGLRGGITFACYARNSLGRKEWGERAVKMDFLYKDEDEILSDSEWALKTLHYRNDRVSILLGPPTTVLGTPSLLKELHELAKRYGSGIHTHLAEDVPYYEIEKKVLGKGVLEFLHDLGILDSHFSFAHCIVLPDDELELLKQTGAHVVHNPVSNMYTGSGVAPVPKMMDMGINVALGTDGGSIDGEDMMSHLFVASSLQKVNSLDASLMPAEKVLEMATLNGAKMLGLKNQIGSLETGKKADLAIVDLNKPHLAPVHYVVSNLVYCANGADVDTVIINGEIVMENRKILTVNEEEIINKASKAAEDLVERSGRDYLQQKTWPSI